MMRTRLLVAALVAVGLTLLMAQLVLAHSRPIRFDPAPGAVLNAPPAQVKGWFTSDLRRDPNWTFLRVTGPDGQRVDAGDIQLSADRRQMTVNLQPNLPQGRYVVTWRAWDDADGHILGDCFTFFVGQEAASQAITDRARLDGGGQCERADIEAAHATPAPGAPLTGAGHNGGGDPQTEAQDSDGVPVWLVILGLAGGLSVGLVAGRLIGSKA
jgi:methionine-rich copper-binding protein CopC